METTVNQRIELLAKSLNLSKINFAKSLDKAPTIISNIINGRNNPNFEFLQKILEVYPQVNAEWLINGEGDIFKRGENLIKTVNQSESRTSQVSEELRAINEKLTEQAQMFMQEITFLRDSLRAKDRQLESRDKELESRDREIEMLLGKYSVSSITLLVSKNLGLMNA